MKKLTDFLKPNILIILGALLFLYYMNWLSNQGAGLAIGIVAVICAIYYIAIGVLEIIVGNKFSPQLKKIFELISVSLFAIFMFLFFLLSAVQGAKIENYMGPTAWIIAILSMVASLALVAIYAISKFVEKPIMVRFAMLFSAIFALALLLNVLFNGRGNPVVLGNIDVILTVIYVAFLFYLFNSFHKEEVQEKKEEVQEKE